MAKKEETAEKKTVKPRSRIRGSKSFVGQNKEIVLRNTLGEDVPQSDYFFMNTTPEEKARLERPENAEEKARLERGEIAPPFFNDVCGMPVEREDLLEVFDKIFDQKDQFLFYRCIEKEVYIIIVPLRFAQIGEDTGARTGEYQAHACSFVPEGSVNVDTLKIRLTKMASTMKYTKER